MGEKGGGRRREDAALSLGSCTILQQFQHPQYTLETAYHYPALHALELLPLCSCCNRRAAEDFKMCYTFCQV